MSAPAGWYPTSDGQLRYWDGAQWTRHLAPSPAGQQSDDYSQPADRIHALAPNRGRLVDVGPSTWCGFGGLGIVALLGAVSAGVGGLFSLSGVYVLLVAVIALIRGQVRWAGLRSRAAGSVALGVALVLAAVGGATADPPQDPLATAASSMRATSPSAQQSSASSQAPSSPPTSTVGSASPSGTPTTTTTSSTNKPPLTPATAAKGTALAAVAKLAVKGRAPKSGYSREQYGQAWFDTDRNGCDTRNDMLRRDLRDRDMKNWCKVLAGTRSPDPYTGKKIRFVVGGASEIDIDHVVALSDAWQKGAATWNAEQRLAFANDPLNLLAVDAGANRSKGDGDVATWLPPNKSYRCDYVARVVSVKVKYQVWVTPAERHAMIRVLSGCATTALPSPGPAPTTAALPKTAPTATPQPTPAPPAPKPETPSNVYYENCDAVRAANADPIREGQPGYARHLDRDGDGVGCER